MKNLIYLCLAFCMATTAGFAQKLTDKDLQGTWSLVALDVLSSQGIYLDLVNNDIKFSEELQSQATPEVIAQAKESMTSTVDLFKQMKMIINGNEIKQSVPGDEQTGIYSIVNEGEKQILKIIFEDGTDDYAEFYIKDKKLHVNLGPDGLFIYAKKQ
ncbi:hypothetical protein V1389_12680 [Flavobacterium rakeshii]|uniref:hypothetical protein n=1 Tax=Flavobacterium rakeshii TaxID=1038845 RepID=UPI002E7AE17B|nr:hypothetical protein [Flavobacterium rakeshii]MEE1899201.1 hypothetical protein [Flavobacterium rakeshii]